MPRNHPESRQNPRQNTDASQAIGGQPRSEDDEDALQKPEDVPSLLTAKELRVREPAKGGSDKKEK